jgi:hypothetical protein
MSESTGGRKAFLLRIAPDLWADLEVWARDELRSVNGQIEFVLRQAVLRRKRGSQPDGIEKAAVPGDTPGKSSP